MSRAAPDKDKSVDFALGPACPYHCYSIRFIIGNETDSDFVDSNLGY